MVSNGVEQLLSGRRGGHNVVVVVAGAAVCNDSDSAESVGGVGVEKEVLVGVPKDDSGVLVVDAQLPRVLQGACDAGVAGGGVDVATALREAVDSVRNGPRGGGGEQDPGRGGSRRGAERSPRRCSRLCSRTCRCRRC